MNNCDLLLCWQEKNRQNSSKRIAKKQKKKKEEEEEENLRWNFVSLKGFDQILLICYLKIEKICVKNRLKQKKEILKIKFEEFEEYCRDFFTLVSKK